VRARLPSWRFGADATDAFEARRSFVIRVDNSTGIVDVVPMFAGNAEMSQIVTRYFLDHYVTVCERFNFSTAESDYEECASFHAPARNSAWVSMWDRSNPLSP